MKTAFGLIEDFDPIALLATNPSVIVLKKNTVPAMDLNELMRIRANQDQVSAGSAGVGAGTHVAGLLFQNVTKTRFRFVPCRGTRVIGQHGRQNRADVQTVVKLLDQTRAGTIGAYAVMGKARGNCPRYSDRGRGEIARLLHARLAWHLTARGHAEGNHRQTEPGSGDDLDRYDRSEKVSQYRAGDLAPPPASAEGVPRLPQG